MGMGVVPTQSRHVIMDLYGCDPVVLKDPERVLTAIRDGAIATGARIVHEHVHDFGGDGASAVCVLAESHITIHTWPGERYASVDCNTCGDCDPARSIEVVRASLGASRVEAHLVTRGHGRKLRMMRM